MENNEKEFLEEEKKPELPAGVIAIAIVTLFSGVAYVVNGFVGIWLMALPNLYSILYLGGGIIMIVLVRSLVQLNLWALWGTMAMFAVTILLILVNPFASLQVWDDPYGRISGAAVFLILICYLGMPSIRGKFTRPDRAAIIGW